MSAQDWRPTATRAALLARAELLARTRAFFAARAVLEVQTPALVGAATSDPQIQSYEVRGPQGEPRGYLHSSPEYAMKRLLAAGSGDIFQLCPVFRAEERSRLHNPEFTLLEWYRLGFGLTELMQETAQLAQLLLDEGTGRPIELIRYSEAFQHYLGLEPLEASLAELAQSAREHGLAASSLAMNCWISWSQRRLARSWAAAACAACTTTRPPRRRWRRSMRPMPAPRCALSSMPKAWSWPTAMWNWGMRANSSGALRPTGRSGSDGDWLPTAGMNGWWPPLRRACRPVPASPWGLTGC